ncbi:uncharacterized protein LOC141801671 [Halichoeres trimaculatus]|uniref:uncharacterized protein LOC141801671 n=1 Tax=Halichoeres trimaculatus TaxID=147232 RepID=UPI003D9ECA5D
MSVFHGRKDIIRRRPPAVVNKDLAEKTTPSGYEEELHRQRNELDVIVTPGEKLQRAVYPADAQQLMVSKVSFQPEEQERSLSLNQEDMKPPHIKEEQEELWSCQGGVYPGGPDRADTTKLPSTVKSEEDEEKPESSQFYAVYITQIEADEENPEGPEPSRYSNPEKHLQPKVEVKTEESSEPETEVSDDYLKERGENKSGLISVKNEDIYQSTAPFDCDRKQDVCSESDKVCYHPLEVNTETRSSGSGFENQFTEIDSLGKYMMVHKEEKQEDPESTQVKDEQEEIWISQSDTIYSPLIPGPIKSKYDKKEPWSLQLNQRQTNEMETRADIEDCGGPEPAVYSDPERLLQPGTEDFSEPETEDSDDWRETREHHSGSKSLISTNHERQKTGDKSHGCTECGKAFKTKWGLIMHVRLHTGEKLLSCSVCDRKFNKKDHLRSHMKVHTEEKPFSCSDCGKKFKHKCSLKPHIARHRCRKSYSCGVSDQHFSGFDQGLPQNQTELRGETDSGANRKHIGGPDLETYKQKLAMQVEIHSGEKPFGCSVCGTRFKQKGNLTAHMFIHTGEKPFSCSVCGKRFRLRGHLNTHVVIHTGEKSFSCSFCSKGFKHKQNLTAHMFIHTGEKPFSCSECGKTFRRRGHLNSHMVVHTGEKPFICAICGKTFKTEGSLKRHMVGHNCS